MNIFNIRRAFDEKKRKNWPYLFWLVDCHFTLIEGKYNRFNEDRELYPSAQEVLSYLSKREDMVLILWSSMYEDSAMDIVNWCRSKGILFDYFNENPLVPSDSLCDFSKKPYVSIILDDRAGFEPNDWELVKAELVRIGEWDL
jgi:hypothetical protein